MRTVVSTAGSASAGLLDRVFTAEFGGPQCFATRASEYLLEVLARPATPAVVADVSALVPLLCRLSWHYSSPQLIDGLLAAAQFHYERGAPNEGLRPADDAVRAARRAACPSLLRKALTFRAAVRADAGAYGSALEDSFEALEVANQTGEFQRASTLWNNIGTFFMQVLLLPEASACFQRVVALDPTHQLPHNAAVSNTSHALTNLASICLYERRWEEGLDHIAGFRFRDTAPPVPSDFIALCIAASVSAQLFLGMNRIVEARRSATQALEYADRSGAERSRLEAAIPLALCDVYEGQTEVGLAKLDEIVRRARPWPGFIRDSLGAAIKGSQRAGRPDTALAYLRELMSHTSKVQRENALQAHQLKLREFELELDLGTGRPDEIVSRERRMSEVLSQQLVARQRATHGALLLEQLAITAELRDDNTGAHPFRVGRLASMLAASLGLVGEVCDVVQGAARVHDIGKVSVPDAVLAKSARLGEDERALMQEHCAMGEELIRQCDIAELETAAQVARSHHENWDGSGYPDGLKGEAIPLAARITALAETFDALTHPRAWRPAKSVQEALQVIAEDRGTRFDPVLTDQFIALIERLVREVDDLDEYLGQDAKRSSFLQARARIAATLQDAGAASG
jgi:putative two-component system response regulator